MPRGQNRQRILDGGEPLLHRHGYAATGVREIADAGELAEVIYNAWQVALMRPKASHDGPPERFERVVLDRLLR